jgi:hypothetical protein
MRDTVETVYNRSLPFSARSIPPICSSQFVVFRDKSSALLHVAMGYILSWHCKIPMVEYAPSRVVSGCSLAFAQARLCVFAVKIETPCAVSH